MSRLLSLRPAAFRFAALRSAALRSAAGRRAASDVSHPPAKDAPLADPYEPVVLLRVAGPTNLARAREHAKELEEITLNARATCMRWKKVYDYICFPVLVAFTILTYQVEKEHYEHLKRTPPEPPKWDCSRKLEKPFPWGDGHHTLFHNALVNYDPPYEEGEE